MKSILAFLVLFIPVLGLAQGMLIDDARYEQLPRQSNYNDGSKSEEKALKGITQHSLKAYCPRVQDQGRLATCVGWSVGYAALSIQQAIKNDWKGQTDLITRNAFSAHYIFNQIKITDCHNGSFIDSAMVLLQTRGNLYSSEFDEDKTDCARQPTEEELERASNNTIVDYMTLFKRNASKRVKINKVKISLLENKPVVFGLMTPKSFTASNMRGTPIWFPQPDERGIFGHAITVVGFDDAKGAFEVMNSWSEDWGDKGFVWIRYNDFAKYCSYAFQMSIDEKIKRAKQYTGKFALRRFVALMKNGVPLFKDVPLAFDTRKKHYQLKQNETIGEGKIFQLLVSQVNAGMYLYAFGIEPDEVIKTYFPLDNESPKITVPEVELFIPGPDAGLQFNKSGKEYVVLLYAAKPILDFEERLKEMSSKKGDPLKRIYEVFGERVLPIEYIGYSKRYMQFENEMPQGSIIPLVLEMNIK